MTTEAEKIASVSRYSTARGCRMGYLPGCVGDVKNNVSIVTPSQWQYLPSRAKTWGAVFLQGRGWHLNGRAFGTIVAPDSSIVTVVLQGGT